MKLQDVRGIQLTAESKSALNSNALTAPRRLEEGTFGPAPVSTGIKVEAVKQNLGTAFRLMRRYNNLQLKRQTNKQDSEKVEKKRQLRRRCVS